MYAVGLNNVNHIVLQGSDSTLAYRPASDICNLFPPLFDVSLNHLMASADVDEKAVAQIRETIAEYLSEPAHETKEFTYAAKLKTVLDALKEQYPELYSKLAEIFMYSSMVAYSLAVKAKLKGDTVANINRDVYPMFALINVFSDLSEETRKAVVDEMTEKHLWGL
jgi:hypothetical protein